MDTGNGFEVLRKMVGANIKKIRLIRGVEVKQLCLDLHISPAAYSNIERGVTDVTISKLVLLADYLRVSYGQILDFGHSGMEQQAAAAEPDPVPQTEQHKEGYVIALEQAREENRFLRDQNTKLLNMVAAQRAGKN